MTTAHRYFAKRPPIVTAVIVLFSICLIGCPSSDQEAWSRFAQATSEKQMRVIGDALMAYHNDHGAFPPGLDWSHSDTERRLSWRVHLLPYIGDAGRELHSKFRLNEAWNSEHNSALLGSRPGIYESPTRGKVDPTITAFLAMPPSTPLRDSDVKENSPDRVLIVEVDQDRAVPWTKPIDISAPNPNSGIVINGRHQGKYLVLLRNGSIEVRPGNVD